MATSCTPVNGLMWCTELRDARQRSPSWKNQGGSSVEPGRGTRMAGNEVRLAGDASVEDRDPNTPGEVIVNRSARRPEFDPTASSSTTATTATAPPTKTPPSAKAPSRSTSNASSASTPSSPNPRAPSPATSRSSAGSTTPQTCLGGSIRSGERGEAPPRRKSTKHAPGDRLRHARQVGAGSRLETQQRRALARRAPSW